MDLQAALVLIGVVIVLAVVVGSYDRARLSRREQRRDASGMDLEPKTPAADDAANSDFQLDINPGPPADLEKKSLKWDSANLEPTAERDSPIYRALEGFEQVASRPLNLGPTLAPNRRPAAPGNEALAEFDALFPRAHERGPNPRIDFIVYLPGQGPVMRDQALGVYKQNEYVLDKPRQLCGLRYLMGHWSSLEHDPDDAQYSDLALAVQMVDRRGPIGESELSAFMQLALKLADAFNRRTRLAITVEQATERARELQSFAEKYDVIASVSVVAENGGGFNGRAIEQAAKHYGMDFGAMNIFHMKNDNTHGCRHLFSMANLYQPGAFDPSALDTFTTQGLTLFMTIPCVHEPAHAFEKMIDTAKGLGEMLGGRLMDQDKRPLTDEGLSAIHWQIKRIAADISAQGISPGSETALRFFNP
ncbi:MAG: cell division protein ZipA C-terminal FtsZ-binding domain-containing protein [Acidiferrobacterales bacterium]